MIMVMVIKLECEPGSREPINNGKESLPWYLCLEKESVSSKYSGKHCFKNDVEGD